MNAAPLVMERYYDVSPEIIWQALTDKTKMKEWYFDVPDFEPVVGNEFSFIGGDETKAYKHLCRVTEVINLRKLSYTWAYEGYDGESLLTFELSPEGSGTRLRLTHAGLETFPQTGDFKKENLIGGWTYFMTGGLHAYLANRDRFEDR